MSNQSGVQQDIRDSTGTAGTWSEDWSALFDADAVAAGTWDERLLAWINGKLSSSYTNVNAAKQAYAVDQGFANWSSIDSVTLVLSGAATLASGETNVFSLDFTDSFWQASTGIYGSAYVRDATTPANNYNSHPYGLLSYTSPSNKKTRKSDGVFRFGAHNLYLNSAAPANQSITVISGATYSVTITGSVSVTASGAATGTWTAGTNTFTAATGTLTLGSTSGAGTVHVRRTPSDNLYPETAGVARYALPFEWDAAGNLIGIVREPAATNLVLHATDISNAAWIKSRSATGSAVANFMGLTGAYPLLETTENATHRIFQGATIVANETYCFSAILKANGRNVVRLRYHSDGEVNGVFARVNLADGTFFTAAATTGTGTLARSGIENLGSGRYRVFISGKVDPAATIATQLIQTCLDNGTDSYVGDITKGVIVEHTQLEAGEYPTSPIITHGATATRAVDQISVAQTALPAIGTAYGMYFEGEYINNALNYPEFVEYSGATDAASIFINPSNNIKLLAADNSVTQADLGSTLTATAGTTFRAAGAWKANDLRISANGGAVQTDNSGTLPTDFTSLILGNTGYMRIKKVAVFYRELSDAELISLSGTGALS